MKDRASIIGRAATVALLAALAAACSARERAKASLEPIAFTPSHDHPVVIIPGILGSRLIDPVTGRELWGKAFDLRALTVHESLVQPRRDGAKGLELPIDSDDLRANRDRLIPVGILDSFTIIPHLAEVKVYRELLAALSVCGYRPGTIESCGAGANAGVFYYDWRRDLVETAQSLATRIREIQVRAGKPDLQVDIVAHSMGGLIAEYYLLYGDEDVLDRDPLPPPTFAGARNVRRLVLLGTPNEGALEAFRNLHEGFRAGLRRVSNQATFTLPSLYELLPAPATARFADAAGRPIEVDLYDPAVWQRYGFGVFAPPSRRQFLRECKLIYPKDWQRRSIEISDRLTRFLGIALRRAVRFHKALEPFATVSLTTEVALIGSAARATLVSAQVVPTERGWRLSFGRDTFRGGLRPNDPLAAAPGDGTVTARSLTWGTLPGGDARPPDEPHAARFTVTWVDDDHTHLPENPDVLRRIAVLLGRT